MKIHLTLYASLARFLPEKSSGKTCVMEVKEGTRLGQVLEDLQVPLKSARIIFLNGVHAERNTVLRNGDRVSVFPPVAGG
jgi:sulfur carrier protein